MVINKIGKIGIHKKDLLDALSIKNIPIFEFKKVIYIGENIFKFNISPEKLSDYVNICDIVKILDNYYRIVEILDYKIKVIDLVNKDRTIDYEINEEVNIAIFPNIFGIYDHNDKNILRIDSCGNIFYKTIDNIAILI